MTGFDELDGDTLAKVALYGHQVIAVHSGAEDDADEGWQPFAYTVGRTSQGRPELLITGDLDPEIATTILNDAAAYDDQTPLTAETTLPPDSLLSGLPVKIVAADPDAAEMNQATHLFGRDKVSALQVLWPDQDGRFPGDDGFVLAEPTFPTTED